MSNLFVEEIAKVARENKIKITDVAKYLGCSRVAFYNWTHGVEPIPHFDFKIRELHELITTTNNPRAAFYSKMQ